MPLPTPVNEYYFGLPQCRAGAEGISSPADAPADGIPQNGGITIREKKVLAEPDRLVKFISAKYSKVSSVTEVNLNTPWWISYGMFDTLIQRYQDSGSLFDDFARTQMLLPLAWNDAKAFLIAAVKPNVLLGAWLGAPRTVHPGSPGANGPESRFTAAGPQAKQSWMYQMYIPGLEKTFISSGTPPKNNAADWLQVRGIYTLPDKRVGPGQTLNFVPLFENPQIKLKS